MNERDVSEALDAGASRAPTWPDAPGQAIAIGRKRTQRNRAVVVGAVAAACIVGVGGWRLIGNESASPAPAGSVPGPRVAVLDTAKVYLRAAAAGDCAMTKALESPKIATTMDWCQGDPKLVKYKITGPPTAEGPPVNAVKEVCVPSLVTNSATKDGTMQAGTTPWSWCFVKTAAGWRLYDQGTG